MSLALFLSLLVKSSLIAAVGLIVARFGARRAADRVDILRATVCLLLALPVLAAILPAVEVTLLPASSVEAVKAPITPLWSGEVGPVELDRPALEGRCEGPDRVAARIELREECGEVRAVRRGRG